MTAALAPPTDEHLSNALAIGWLTPAMVASMRGRSLQTIRNDIASGVLPSVALSPRCVLIAFADARDYIKHRKTIDREWANQ